MASSSSSSSAGSWKYDVFLSFRGEDTRKTFVDHLYSALQQHHILTYKDDVTLDRGDTIGPSLMSAIQESQIALIIFSENYAESSWCLDELSHIMKCKEERCQIVMPVFYGVDPSDVRQQKGHFGKAFAKHNNNNKVESWKKALVDVTNIAGWEPKHVANGHEAKCIEDIIGSILDRLPSLHSVLDDENLVGMGTRLQELKSQLKIGAGGVRMVGIWGVGGGGKTTLATSLYMELKISGHFDGSCFVDNIREESKQQHGLKSLQKKILRAVFEKKMEVESVDIGKKLIESMLCRRNVLIVLDDVDHLDQLKALAGSREWFGNGSRIIITTRDEHLLTTHRVDAVSPISLLSHEEAIGLFNRHAYNENEPVRDYKMLSEHIVIYAAGIPLALIVLGSFLYDKDNDEWIGTLSRLKDHSEMDIVEKLKISYDGLKPVEKELFLDIACFHRRESKDEAMETLDACGFYPCIGVRVLIQKALITVSEDGHFDMHDLVQEMAHYIVRGEHPNNPEKHSRVWRNNDIEEMCSRNARSENNKIEAIRCYADVCSSSFNMLVSNMKKLRFLKVTTLLKEGPSFLSNELRYIDWHHYPACLFPASFRPPKLAVLIMRGSLQKELWKDNKYLPCLKELKLVGAIALVRTPDLAGLPCLQKLILDGCESLEEIHQSHGNHASLVYLYVRFCLRLTRFQSIVGMEKLQILEISYCPALIEFPNEIAELSNLQELYLCGNDFTRLHFSFSKLTRLKLLDVSYCHNLVELPELPSSLAILTADECNSLEVIRDDIHTNCKWLSQVSLTHGCNITGGDRLLESMLQGNAIESHCMSLQLQGFDIAKNGFMDRLVSGEEYRLQLPHNWYNAFLGFLVCVVFSCYDDIDYVFPPTIAMKHEKKDGSIGMGDSQHGMYCEVKCVVKFVVNDDVTEGGDDDDDNDGTKETVDDYQRTWVGYIPFGLLRHTLWWDETSTTIEFDIDSNKSSTSFGFKLIPKRSESVQSEIPTTSSCSEDDYKCPFEIRHDSKSTLICSIGSNDDYGTEDESL